MAVGLAARLWPIMAQAAAEPAAKPAVRPAASPGPRPLEKAAKDNKYLFIFFWREDTHRQPRHAGRVPGGDGEDDRQGRLDGDSTSPTPPKSAIVARYDVQPGAHAAGPGHRPQRRRHQGVSERFDEKQLQTGVCQPLHGRVHEGHSGPQSCFCACRTDKRKSNQEAMQGVQDFKADAQYAKATEIVVLNPRPAETRS